MKPAGAAWWRLLRSIPGRLRPAGRGVDHWARLGRWLATAAGAVLLVGIAVNAWVLGVTRHRIYDETARVPIFDCALVLGTSPYTHTGKRNALFVNRIKAAATLYRAGRVRHLLVSGANPSPAYNEPRKMYKALRRRGVPDSAITLDFAGFRTLDSVVRARRIFGLHHVVIVSQRYHEYRALFIARYSGIDAVGYDWPGEDRRQSLRTEAREYLARIKAVLDLFVLHTRPRYLGPPRPIDLSPTSAGGYLAAGLARPGVRTSTRLSDAASRTSRPDGPRPGDRTAR